jgi:hypothetical protein
MEGYKEFVMLDYPKSVVIEEQGLRDGLQNQDIFVPTGKKLQIIHALIDAGMKRIQVTSFVNPEMIPQMADADDLYAKLPQKNEVVYSALVLNPKGMERAARAGATHVTASISVSNTHSQRNTGMSLETARKQFSEMVAIGKSHALTIRGGLNSWIWASMKSNWQIPPVWPIHVPFRNYANPLSPLPERSRYIYICMIRKERGLPMPWPRCRSASPILTVPLAEWGDVRL